MGMLSNCTNKIVGSNSAKSAATMADEMLVNADDLARTPFHHFWIRTKEASQQRLLSNKKNISIKFIATDKFHCDDTLESEYYLSEVQAKDEVDNYMINQGYYRKLESLKPTVIHSEEQLDKQTLSEDNLN